MHTIAYVNNFSRIAYLDECVKLAFVSRRRSISIECIQQYLKCTAGGMSLDIVKKRFASLLITNLSV